MLGLSIIDLAVLIVYFGVVLAIGYWARSRIHNQEDFFLGGRRFGKLIQTFAAFGQGTSSESAVGVTTTVYSNGASGIWSSLLYIFAAPVYWMTSPWYRRLRLLTLGDFFFERYQSRRMAMTYSVFAAIGSMAVVAIGVAAMSKTVVALTPKSLDELSFEERVEHDLGRELLNLEALDYGSLTAENKSRIAELQKIDPKVAFSHVNEVGLVIFVSIIVVLYGIMGGLHAAFLTDLLQGGLIIILSVLLLPFAMVKVNAFYGGESAWTAFGIVKEQLPEASLKLFGSAYTVDFTWYYIVSLCIMVTLNVAIQPNQLVAIGSAKDEYSARFGFVAGNFMKRAVTVLWGIFALFAIVLYEGTLRNPDLVWGYATLDLLGSLNVGLVGLMTACLLSALMSTADCHMITASSLLTNNVYGELFPGKEEKHYLVAGRIFGLLVISGGAWLAVSFSDILSMLKFLWGFFSVFAPSFWLGMVWRRASARGAWCSIGVGAMVFVLLPAILPSTFSSLRYNEDLLVETPARVFERSTSESSAEQQQIPGKSVYWSDGIGFDKEGVLRGKGMFNLELWLISRFGFDLSKNSYAINETLRNCARILLPFGVLLSISFFGRNRLSNGMERFFAKMRVPVVVDREEDRHLLELAYESANSNQQIKLFPESEWEFKRWNKEDAWGFVVSCLAVVCILASLLVIL